MGMVVRTNTPAMNANRQLGINSNQVSKSLEKLSSGFKINRAADDASGLAISEKMKAQIKGLETASANSQDGISLIQTAEGGAQEIHDMLNRMTELATKSANGTIQNEVDREAIQREVDDLNSEITRIAQSTNFNGINLLDGTLGGGSVTSDGTTFSGSVVAKSAAAKLESGATVKHANMADIDTTDAAKDVLAIDGKKVTIDWTSDANKGLAAMFDQSQVSLSEEGGKDLAKKLQEVINNAAAEQGVSGTVSVSYDDGSGKFTIKSDNKGADSEVSFLGSTTSTGAAVADAKTSIMNKLVGGGAATIMSPTVNKASLTYNGDALGTGSKFQMTINGVKVGVNIGDAVTIGKGDTMDSVAGKLQTAIRNAVSSYNSAMGLTAGTEDPASGLTGLTTTDFKVSVGDDGNFKVTYGGDEDVSYSFEDVGEKSIASTLGLAGGSSTSGGNQGLTLQIGDTGDSFNKVTVSVDDLSARGIGTFGLDVSTQTASNAAIKTIKSAINQVSTNRANLGSLQNRLEHTINNLDTTAENMTAANSRIRDTDMAKEMMNYTKMNVLVQSAQAMLAQANQQPQSILQLLQ